jgi:hypothetical protein
VSLSTRRRTVTLALLAITLAAWPGAAPPAAAQVVIPVSELIENPEGYAGGQVSVTGELIGDYGFRSNGYMWTQLNDDTYVRDPVVEGGELAGGNTGIGIRMPDDLARDLDPPGGYRRRGPIVLVTGTYAFHDRSRQGETFIDVEVIEIIEPGRRIDEGIDVTTLVAGAALLLAAGALHWWRRRRLLQG